MKELAKFVLFLIHLTHHFSLGSVTTTFDKYFPSSCQDPSIIKDGEYYIYPDGLVPVHVYCDVTNGGWTTVFHKTQKSDFFNRTWTDYLYGFGDPGSDYWAGLVNIRNLVLTEPMILRIELSNSDEDEFYIEYESFYVGPEETGFVLHVGNRTRGNLMDTFSGMSRAKFFTHDRLNHGEQVMRIGDMVVTVNLTHTSGQLHHANFRGAWWYHHEASHAVCLTCNPKSPFEGNYFLKKSCIEIKILLIFILFLFYFAFFLIFFILFYGFL